MNNPVFDISKNDCFSLLIERLEAAKEIVKFPSDWIGYESNIANAKNILKAYYSGASVYAVIAMPLHY